MKPVRDKVYGEKVEAYLMEEIIETTYDISLKLTFYLFHDTDRYLCSPVVNKVRRWI
jgi:hypothetical protein